ncbi:MAG: hypothetical protein ACOCYW_06945 [Roseicyclus sp.]
MTTIEAGLPAAPRPGPRAARARQARDCDTRATEPPFRRPANDAARAMWPPEVTVTRATAPAAARPF